MKATVANSMSQRDTSDNASTPPTPTTNMQEVQQNMLAGGSKQRDNKYAVFPESFSESPLKLYVFIFREKNE